MTTRRALRLPLRVSLLSALTLCSLRAFAGEPAPILYELRPLLQPQPAKVRVTMHIPVREPNETLTIQMPTWTPGDYRVQNHAKFVLEASAQAAGASPPKALVIERTDANTWRIAAGDAETVAFAYDLAESPPGLFSENLRLWDRQLFLNGAAVFAYVAGRKESPAKLTALLPAEWKGYAPLRVEAEQAGSVTFAVPDYDTLADTPLLLAHPAMVKVAPFTVDGKPHRIVFFGQAHRVAKPETYPPVIRKIVEAGSQLMRGLPYDRYDFFCDVAGYGGGLEHANSTRIALWATSSPEAALGLFSHEFFHAWNVKRIRPRVLGPIDYIVPPKTRNLWFAEGVTEYYSSVLQRRAGLIPPEGFLRNFRGGIRSLQRNAARLKVTADDSSLRVWEANNSAGFGGISYYQKGELIGLCLDLKLRHVTQNRRSLDDVMRELMKRGAPPKAGYDEDELREVINHVAERDLTAFYHLLARSTEEMPFAECLGYVGLDMEMQPLLTATPEQIALREAWTAQAR